jgi:hypothetical protein
MTNGLVLLRDSAKGHLGGAEGSQTAIPTVQWWSKWRFLGGRPYLVFIVDLSAITMLCNQISSFSEIYILLIN